MAKKKESPKAPTGKTPASKSSPATPQKQPPALQATSEPSQEREVTPHSEGNAGTATPESLKVGHDRLRARPESKATTIEARASKVAARQAAIEAQKAEREAARKAAADERAAKLATTKAAADAKKAEREEARKALAEAKAAKLADIKAANEAKKAAAAAAKPTLERKPVTRPEKPLRPVQPARPAVKTGKEPTFAIGLRVSMDSDWEKVIQDALLAATTPQLQALLKINPESDAKVQRELENDKRKLIRIIERGISTAFTRLLEPSHLQCDHLQLNAEGTRILAPAKPIAHTAAIQNKVSTAYRDIIAISQQANAPLQQFQLKDAAIALTYGDALPGGFYFSGNFKLAFHPEQPEDSTVTQNLHIFAKKGKTLGAQLKISFSHDLTGKTFAGTLQADFPVESKG